MTLTEVVLQTSNPVSFNLEDADPSEILILESISGLTPQPVTNYTGDFSRDGGYYQGRRVGQRFPVFNFRLNPNYAEDIAVSDIREMLYRQFYEPQEDSDGVTTVLKDDRRPDRYLTCYADKWDGEIFSKETKGQISTVCVDAYILSVDQVHNVNPGVGWGAVPIAYEGSADTGFEIKLTVIANTPTVKLSNNNAQVMTLEAGTPFLAGDIITISTLDGNRYIRVNGVDRMAIFKAGSKWVQLKSQMNLLRSYGSTPGDGLAVINEYKYRAAWRGV